MDDNQTAKSPMRRWIKYLLVASLGFNILIIGLVGGSVLRGGPPDRIMRDREISMLGLRVYFSALESDQQSELREKIAESRRDHKDGKVVFAAHLKSMADALSAEPFDLGEVETVLTTQAGLVRGNISSGHRLLLDHIDGLTKAERAAMAKSLLDPRRWRRREHRDEHGEDRSKRRN